ncbi:MAG: 2-hydroxyacid dehydrogenase [Sediminibacterium sp.]|nr:2-hydroxyacid dehydrogenase [Sediminibacterium sp.]MBP6145407.1 2-hydroxyacid dehydrogenase [Sediminibacterium sp.]
MKIAFFSTQAYDKQFFTAHNALYQFELVFFEAALSLETVELIQGVDAVCVFVNDKVDAAVLKALSSKGVKVVALRCAGFNNVDLEAAKANQISVCRVPAYSPASVAEHAVAMILTLNRKTNKAYNRVREQNFSLVGLLGFNLKDKKVAVIGTGKIGAAFARIMLGFGCEVHAFDLMVDEALEKAGVIYQPLLSVIKDADIISLHCPLNEQTKHIVNPDFLAQTKKGVMLINTSRGGLIDTKAAIEGLKTGHIGYLGIDVYEQEEKLFFKDLSSEIILDDTIQRLMSFPNVFITAHQAFFTKEAMDQIATTTLENLRHLLGDKKIDEQALQHDPSILVR